MKLLAKQSFANNLVETLTPCFITKNNKLHFYMYFQHTNACHKLNLLKYVSIGIWITNH
jgi:hypothetical protein